MDKYLVSYELEDGSNILIEATDPNETELELLSDDGNTIKASEKFEKALSHLKPVAEVLFGSFAELNNPSEIQLEMGIKFSAKAGIIFASADSEAAFKITLKWNN